MGRGYDRGARRRSCSSGSCSALHRVPIGASTLRRTAEDLKRWGVTLNDAEAVGHAIGERIHREIIKITLDESSLPRIKWLAEVLNIVQTMPVQPTVWKSQNIFYLLTKGYRKEQWVFLNDDWKTTFEELAKLLKVRLK